MNTRFIALESVNNPHDLRYMGYKSRAHGKRPLVAEIIGIYRFMFLKDRAFLSGFSYVSYLSCVIEF